MTWPDGIALAVGLTTLALITHHQHQHRSTTTQHTSRTEHRNGPHQQHGEEDHQQPGQEDNRGEEDHQPRTGPA